MNLTKTPPKVHPAFNPIIFEMTEQNLPYPNMAELTVDINGKKTTLARPYISQGAEFTARFDISGIVRNHLSPDEVEESTQGRIDPMLFVEYDVNGTKYLAVNAVAQLGESCDWSCKEQDSLYYSQIVRTYPGYDRDISLLLTNYSIDGIKRNVVLRKPIVPELTDKEYRCELPRFSVTVSPQCIPENPFYVRWLNRLGGIDYNMFCYDQEERVSVKSAQTVKVFNRDNASAVGSDRTYDIKAERSITVGCENISALEFRILTEIATSPLVQWYNESLGRWQTISVAKADNKFNSHHKYHTLEIEFDLPALNLQFA